MPLSAEGLVEDHLDALYGLARVWVRDSDLAQDLTHRTFLKAFEKRGQLRESGAARAWLISILRNEIASEYRVRSRELAWERDTLDDLPAAEPCEEGLDSEAILALPLALQRVPETSRHILLLRFQQELSYEEIASTLALPLGTVMSRLHRAKAAVRAQVMALANRPQEGAP